RTDTLGIEADLPLSGGNPVGRPALSDRTRRPCECRALDGLAARYFRPADGIVARHARAGEARTARPGGDRGGAPPGVVRVDDRRGRTRGPALSGGLGIDARGDRARNHGVPLACVPDRAAAIEES